MNIKQLTGTGQVWIHYLKPYTYAYKSSARLALDWLSPCQVTFCRPPRETDRTTTNPQEYRTRTFSKYCELLRFAYFHMIVQE